MGAAHRPRQSWLWSPQSRRQCDDPSFVLQQNLLQDLCGAGPCSMRITTDNKWIALICFAILSILSAEFSPANRALDLSDTGSKRDPKICLGNTNARWIAQHTGGTYLPLVAMLEVREIDHFPVATLIDPRRYRRWPSSSGSGSAITGSPVAVPTEM